MELTKTHALIMENLKHSEGRKVISAKIEKMIDDYTQAILSIDPEGNEKRYTKHDVYRLLRECLIKIHDEPERIIKLFEEKGRDISQYL